MENAKIYKIYTLSALSDIENVRYVGVTTLKLSQRLSQHKNYANNPNKRGRPVSKWMFSRYEKGDDIVITQIDTCTEENWEEKECYWILEYKNRGFDLMNIDKGGRGVITAEMRSKSSIQRSAEGHYKAVIALNMDGTFYKEYESIVEATKEIGAKSRTSICNNLKGWSKSAYGYMWVYKKDYDLNTKYKYCPNEERRIKVYLFDLEGNLIKEYSKISDFNQIKGYSRNGVRNAIEKGIVYHNTYLSYSPIFCSEHFKSPYKFKIENNYEKYFFKSQREMAKFFSISESALSNHLKENPNKYLVWDIEHLL